MPEDFCPHYIHLKYVEGLRTEPSDAQSMGLYFESELLGCARDGAYKFDRKIVDNKPKKTALKGKMIEYISSRQTLNMRHHLMINSNLKRSLIWLRLESY